MPVSITRLEMSAADLRRAAGRSSDAAVARRLLALAMVMDGCSRREAAERAGMDRQTLRDWVHRYNAEGIAGLADRPHPGPKPCLTGEQMQALEAIVLAGPDPVVDRVVRWRRVDLQAVLKARFGIEVHERTVGKYLARLKLRRLSVRPQHPRSDPAAQEAFKKTSPSW